MTVTVKINKLNNVQIDIESFYYAFNLEITNDNSIIIHNENTGEGFGMCRKSISYLLRKVDCNSFRQLVSLFGGDNDNIKIADNWCDGTIRAYEHIKYHLNKTFDLSNYSNKALLLEAIPTDLTPYIDKVKAESIA